jgi:hypothetical protein
MPAEFARIGPQAFEKIDWDKIPNIYFNMGQKNQALSRTTKPDQ